MQNDDAPENALPELIREAKSAGIHVDSFRNVEHPGTPGLDVAAVLVHVHHRHYLVHRDRRGWAACEVHPGQVNGVRRPADGAELRLGTAGHTPRHALEALRRTAMRTATERPQPRPAPLAA